MVSRFASPHPFSEVTGGVLHQNESVYHKSKRHKRRETGDPSHDTGEDNLRGKRESCREGKGYDMAHLWIIVTESYAVNSDNWLHQSHTAITRGPRDGRGECVWRDGYESWILIRQSEKSTDDAHNWKGANSSIRLLFRKLAVEIKPTR